jgi:S1-C subfamily serine protease
MRAMALGGILLEDLSDEERSKRGLRKDQLALFAKHVGEGNEHGAAKNAGFRKEDVLVEIAGSTVRVSESELIGRLLKSHQPGDKLKTVVLRGSERIELLLPIQ